MIEEREGRKMGGPNFINKSMPVHIYRPTHTHTHTHTHTEARYSRDGEFNIHGKFRNFSNSKPTPLYNF